MQRTKWDRGNGRNENAGRRKTVGRCTSNKELQRVTEWKKKSFRVQYIPFFPPSLERARFNPSVFSRHPISISLKRILPYTNGSSRATHFFQLSLFKITVRWAETRCQWGAISHIVRISAVFITRLSHIVLNYSGRRLISRVIRKKCLLFAIQKTTWKAKG